MGEALPLRQAVCKLLTVRHRQDTRRSKRRKRQTEAERDLETLRQKTRMERKGLEKKVRGNTEKEVGVTAAREDSAHVDPRLYTRA